MIGIIGATGQVGKELALLLAKHRKDFCALVRDQERGQKILGGDVALRDFDFLRPDTFAPALNGLSQVFLVVDRGDNLDRFLCEARNQRLGLVVFMSGLGAQRRTNGPLRKAELALEGSKIPFCSLRANWFMQNFTGLFLNDIKRGELRLPAADATVSFVDARDIAEAALELFTHVPDHNTYFEITGPKAYSHSEVVSLISRTIGKKVSYTSISDEEAKKHLRWDDDTIALFSDMRQGETKKLSNDLSALLWSKPSRTLESFILQHQNVW